MKPPEQPLDSTLRDALSPAEDELARLRLRALETAPGPPWRQQIPRWVVAATGAAVLALTVAAGLGLIPFELGTPEPRLETVLARVAGNAPLLAIERSDGSLLLVQPGNRRKLRQGPFLLMGELQ